MSNINPETRVADLVVDYPDLTRVLEKMGVDFCCGGFKPLTKVCEEKGLDVHTVVTTLQAIVEMGGPIAGNATNWKEASLAAICDHIEQTHHKYLKEELPRLNLLVAKIASVHGERHPELYEVKKIYNRMSSEFLAHLPKEEEALFPAIRQLEAGSQDYGFETVESPIQSMIAEHDATGRDLEKLNELTHHYVTPDDGCNTYKATMDALHQLEHDTHLHVSLENNILFPRAIALEQSKNK